jgi:hypothetical protein
LKILKVVGFLIVLQLPEPNYPIKTHLLLTPGAEDGAFAPAPNPSNPTTGQEPGFQSMHGGAAGFRTLVSFETWMYLRALI